MKLKELKKRLKEAEEWRKNHRIESFFIDTLNMT